MPFALKGIPVSLEILSNDDEETPIRMIGRKMLPILEDADGYMAESLDIVRKIDALDGHPLFAGEPRPEITRWLNDWADVIRKLVVPRTPDPVFPEFRTRSARDYFTAQKEGIVGNFQDLLAQTDAFVIEMETGLVELSRILPDSPNSTIDDILIFPFLRSLSIISNIEMPSTVRAYCDRLSERSTVPLVNVLRHPSRLPRPITMIQIGRKVL